MKKRYIFLILLLTFGLLAGCGAKDESKINQNGDNTKTEQAESTTAAFPVTIKDAVDQEVVIDEKPERIVSLIPSNTEIAFALGLGDEIVGVSDFDNYPEEALEKEKIGSMDFNVEKIISLKPDLVLAHASGAHNSEAGLQQLRDAGITVLVVNDAKNFEDVYDSIKMIGKATGEQSKAQSLVDDMKKKVEKIREKTAKIQDKKKVYIEISAPDIYAAGKNTFMDEMLQIIHAENVVTEEGWPKIEPEAIIAANPDVIITTYGYYTEGAVEQVLSREGWDQVNAVKNSQVFDVNSDIVSRSGPRLAEGVEEIAKAVYPEIFQ